MTVLLLTRPHGGGHGPGPDGTGALGSLGHGGVAVGRRAAPIGTVASSASASPGASSTPVASAGTSAAPGGTPTHPLATGPTVAPVYHTGHVDLSGLEAVDLETGATGGSVTLDVGLGYGSLNALHGAYFGEPTHGSGAGVSRSRCTGTPFTDSAVALSGLSAGDQICVRTGAGHVGAIVVSYVQAGTAIGFGWTLWA